MLLRTQLLAMLAVSTVAQAGWFGKSIDNIFRRQLLDNLTGALDPDASPSLSGDQGASATPTDSGVSATPTERSSSSSSSSSTTPSTSPSRTPTRTPVTTPPVNTPSGNSGSTTGGSFTRSSSSRESSQSSVSEESSDSIATPTPSPTVRVFTTILTEGGSTFTSMSSSTSTPTPTNPASLSSETTSAGGMSPKTKTTVIGVVVGIGGAIVLGALGIVAWRIWGRKKRGEESDDLMGDYNEHRAVNVGHEKSVTVPAPSPSNPFQATLEGYHQPSKVNAAANF